MVNALLSVVVYFVLRVAIVTFLVGCVSRKDHDRSAVYQLDQDCVRR